MFEARFCQKIRIGTSCNAQRRLWRLSSFFLSLPGSREYVGICILFYEE